MASDRVKWTWWLALASLPFLIAAAIVINAWRNIEDYRRRIETDVVEGSGQLDLCRRDVAPREGQTAWRWARHATASSRQDGSLARLAASLERQKQAVDNSLERSGVSGIYPRLLVEVNLYMGAS